MTPHLVQDIIILRVCYALTNIGMYAEKPFKKSRRKYKNNHGKNSKP